ncbi:hypothetical protein IA01_02480 [Flavobacterium psychrophilum]|uniref:Hypothetical transmembrane protein n=7 Tax=Flavobacterium psychrophilum TaxID=96345 RepID=A6GWX7_FLAPJ|nr:hypothetical protein [Flavobacterium psychrophilum]AIG29401.1 hypothetical protein IA03_02460 [Flavobacterium psychrophilum]AIG31678.1 hypothetical protein IA01_02480 [Flavobacterium psychrophilum]AIG33832.1 hypothetical protein IA02_01865 [Flavobacterium psychrophilum]AIG36194.1 hypothetical protein IA04_02370 [Flavobacterium psychrophilum]AIG38460.1 hypothetical protein IA05_02455 [Flavobacterium psychrophilum]
MNVFSKRLDKFKSFYNNPNPFKNKADDFVFRFFGVSLIFVILRIIIDYFSKEYVIKGMYEYVAFAIVQLSIILACFFSLILKNIFVKSQIKSLEPITSDTKESESKNISDEEKLDDKLVENLIDIKDELKLKSQKQFAFLLLCSKENNFQLRSDTWFLEHFNKIFKIEIKAQFLSQVKNEINFILNLNNDLSRNQEKYLKLYHDIQDKLNSNI